MNCLCCGKKLNSSSLGGWHKSCIKRFFCTESLPEIKIDEEALKELAIFTTSKGYTVTGVQKKLSLHLQSNGKSGRLTLVNFPNGYILKPQVDDFSAVPEMEQLVMNMAEVVGIQTVPHGLLEVDDKYAYITKRIDREIYKDGTIKMLAMEDFCQLSQRLTQDKYRGSYEQCRNVIKKYSSRYHFDITELFLRLVFSFVVGNSDMHLKNFSLIETQQGSNKYVLSPAYDLLAVNVIMSEDNEQFALTMHGKKTNIHKKDFLMFAESCEISIASANKIINNIVSKKDKLLEMCTESVLPENIQVDLKRIITQRINILEN